MTRITSQARASDRNLPKSPSGIQGLDEVTGGGLPRGRATLVCGTAGCGKTLFAMEFLVRGATQFDEPGLFVAFEETGEELAQNVRSLGFEIEDLVARKKVMVDYVRVERSEIEEAGDYDLDGLFIRMGHAIDAIGAKRVVLDTIEVLFSGLSNEVILRAELRRLFRWLKDRGVTAVITGERGEGTLTRHGLEEYVSDCVILLDHRVIEQVSTRRLRIVKYRGSAHGTNEYPFLIDEDGISVLPITALSLQHQVSGERVATGIPQLDGMLAGGGYYRGGTILVSGSAGSGKSSVAAHFVDAAARRGERTLYLAFEESPAQIVRNMRSIGIDLEPAVKQDLLKVHAARSNQCGLEMHLASLHKQVREFRPHVVVIDPVSSLAQAGSLQDAAGMVTRLIDYLKVEGITNFMTCLTSREGRLEATDLAISSFVDTWLLLRDIELGGERNRAMYILKSRGMAHSNQVREFLLTDRGIRLAEAYLGPEGVLTGSARQAQEARERAAAVERAQEIESKQRTLERKREALEARIAALRREFEAEAEEMRQLIGEERSRSEVLQSDRTRMAISRKSDDSAPAAESPQPARPRAVKTRMPATKARQRDKENRA
jgi:circadian clock protein KaiC